jgi:hypothetical protein
MSYAVNNLGAFSGYRELLGNCCKDYLSGRLRGAMLVAWIGGQAGVPLPFAAGAGGAIPDECGLALAAWLFRYMRRRDTIHGGGDYGDPLADTVARDMLVARHRARDEAIPDLPDWDPAVLEQARRWMVRAYDLRRIEVKALNEPHGYGPSLRRLWAEARGSGGDPWEYMKNWGFHAPAAFGRVGLANWTDDLWAALHRTLEWRSTEDADFPWAAESDGKMYRVRLNDFPDEWMYSLMVDGAEMGYFHDWPESWTRGKAKLAARPRAARAPKKSVRAASNFDPAQLPERYRNGEHVEVWRDLESLGEDVRHARYLQPARAVARETMRRARRNIETIVGRLGDLNYRFIAPGEERGRDLPMADGMREVVQQQGPASALDCHARGILELMAMVGGLHEVQARLTGRPLRPHQPFMPPPADVAKQVGRIERKGIVLPLSLAAWAEVVGSVDLTGAHPALCLVEDEEGFPNQYADPLIVHLPLDELAEPASDPAAGIECRISPDEEGKAGYADCEFYTVRIPDLRADTMLQGERHNTTFVNYLRLAFRWGGFPGWEQYEERPEKELAVLTEGLLPL